MNDYAFLLLIGGIITTAFIIWHTGLIKRYKNILETKPLQAIPTSIAIAILLMIADVLITGESSFSVAIAAIAIVGGSIWNALKPRPDDDDKHPQEQSNNPIPFDEINS